MFASWRGTAMSIALRRSMESGHGSSRFGLHPGFSASTVSSTQGRHGARGAKKSATYSSGHDGEAGEVRHICGVELGRLERDLDVVSS